VDNTSPAVSLSCSEGDKMKGTVFLNFSASDDNLAEVFLRIDDDVLNVTGTSFYIWDTLGVSDGTHIIEATALDKAGNTNHLNISILVDNTAPIIILEGITEGSFVRGIITTNFSVTDMNPVTVLYALDAKKNRRT
jgi:hypothetical protein